MLCTRRPLLLKRRDEVLDTWNIPLIFVLTVAGCLRRKGLAFCLVGNFESSLAEAVHQLLDEIRLDPLPVQLPCDLAVVPFDGEHVLNRPVRGVHLAQLRIVRGGPRNSDSLLRWNPDQGEGVWHATEETELPG